MQQVLDSVSCMAFFSLNKDYSWMAKADNTIKTLKIGTPRLTAVVVLNIKQFDFTMQ